MKFPALKSRGLERSVMTVFLSWCKVYLADDNYMVWQICKKHFILIFFVLLILVTYFNSKGDSCFTKLPNIVSVCFVLPVRSVVSWKLCPQVTVLTFFIKISFWHFLERLLWTRSLLLFEDLYNLTRAFLVINFQLLLSSWEMWFKRVFFNRKS